MRRSSCASRSARSATAASEQQESLATTPMAFRYGSGELVPGFAQRPTLKQAMQRAGDNFVDGGDDAADPRLITLLPWLLALALIGLIVRYVRRRWFPKTAERRPPADPFSLPAREGRGRVRPGDRQPPERRLSRIASRHAPAPCLIVYCFD